MVTLLFVMMLLLFYPNTSLNIHKLSQSKLRIENRQKCKPKYVGSAYLIFNISLMPVQKGSLLIETKKVP